MRLGVRPDRYLKRKTHWICGVRGITRMILRFLALPWMKVNRDGHRRDVPEGKCVGF